MQKKFSFLEKHPSDILGNEIHLNYLNIMEYLQNLSKIRFSFRRKCLEKSYKGLINAQMFSKNPRQKYEMQLV